LDQRETSIARHNDAIPETKDDVATFGVSSRTVILYRRGHERH
jgi:hypothetical protein